MKKIFMLFALVIAIASCSNAQVKATKMTQNELQEALTPFMKKIQEVPDDENAEATVKQLAMDFIAENHNDAGVYLVRALLPQVMKADELIKYVDSDDFLKNDSTVINAKKGWEKLIATEEGKMFVDFEAEYNGKVAKLSDYVGKGKYVLVDFWASWCGPCKREIPNLIKVYNQYKGEKFEVLGVATWDKPEDTLKSIEELGIPYPQMLNAQQAGSDAYGINGIPQIILFGPDGTIIKRNLRGEMIEKTVAELVK